ncbi:MAG: WG repeat-containing protein, partial [candidate division WOR-3 bacterium]
MNTSGVLVIDFLYDRADFFSENLAAVRIGNEWGFIDKRGRVVIKPEYDFVHPFREGLALVWRGGKQGKLGWSGGKYQYIDHDGRTVISGVHDLADDFAGGMARVWEDGLCGYINKTGELVIEPQYVFAGAFSGGLASIWSGASFTAEELYEQEIAEYYDEYDSVFVTYDGDEIEWPVGKFGFISNTGAMV